MIACAVVGKHARRVSGMLTHTHADGNLAAGTDNHAAASIRKHPPPREKTPPSALWLEPEGGRTGWEGAAIPSLHDNASVNDTWQAVDCPCARAKVPKTL